MSKWRKLFVLVTISAIVFVTFSQAVAQKRSDAFHIGKFHRADISEASNSTLPFAIGVASFLYLFNPIVLYQNDKIGGGLTKEVSLGFGYFGEHRFSAEYSYIFREGSSSHLRFGYKYDILLKSGLKPSNMLQSTSALSLGVSYFYDFNHDGVSPELSYGFSIRNDKLLIYPSIKLRYTFINKGTDITDISAGIVVGFANPFIDFNIRREDE